MFGPRRETPHRNNEVIPIAYAPHVVTVGGRCALGCKHVRAVIKPEVLASRATGAVTCSGSRLLRNHVQVRLDMMFGDNRQLRQVFKALKLMWGVCFIQ